MNFKDKKVIVTGASSGIGKQVAIDFSNNGVETMVLVSRSKTKLERVEKLLNPKCETRIYPCDISKKNEVIEMGKEIEEKYNHVDILVNNAGFGRYGKVLEQTLEEIEQVTFTNYLGMIYCTKVFLNSMIKNGSGHIVNVASLAASFGIPGMAAYCGSKFAMLGFSESLYHELKGTGVGITVVSPVAVRTNFFDNDSFKGKMPHKIGYVLDPKKVSKAVMQASNSQRLEIIVPFFARSAVWLKHTFPYFVNPIVRSSFK